MSIEVDVQVEKCYAKAVKLDALKIPYLYGGDTLAGLDCSKADSWVLKAGGILTALMGTHELETTPELLAGEGADMTLWVANTALLEHSLLEFDCPVTADSGGQPVRKARSSASSLLQAAGITRRCRFKPRRRPSTSRWSRAALNLPSPQLGFAPKAIVLPTGVKR